MQTQATNAKSKIMPLFSIVFGCIGLFASWQLAVEYLKKLQTPGYVPNCDWSLLVTCGPNMESWQGSLFGFSNTFIGLAAFMAPIFIGFALLAKAKFQNWFWRLYLLGLTFGIVFVFWLSWQSVFVIGTLCPWCMVVWAVTIPLFWITLAYVAKNGLAGFRRGKPLSVFFADWSLLLVFLSYIAIAFYAQLALDWIGFLLVSK